MQKNWMLAVAALCLTTGAQAQWPGGGRTQTRLVLEALDLNHDGSLSADEIKAAPQSLLALDKNGDGKITLSEVSARPAGEQAGGSMVDSLMAFDKQKKGYLVQADLPERMRGIFERGDSDHDGKLTAEEIRKMGARQTGPEGPAVHGGAPWSPFRTDPLLAALDLDHDGELSPSEIAAASTSLMALDKNGNGQIDPEEMKPHQMTPSERLHHFIDEFDTNKDGKIERNEAPERMVASEFDKIDTNKDGVLDQEELLTFFTQQAQGGQPEHQH